MADCCFLVTGATGFIGMNLVRHLVAAREHVVVVARGTLDAGPLAPLADRLEVIRTDLVDLTADALPAPPCPRIVLHLAGAGVRTTDNNDDLLVSSNIIATQRVVRLVSAWAAERLVHFGSCFEYGARRAAREDDPMAPVSSYGATKAAATLLVQAAARRTGLPAVVLRPFSVYGPLEHPERIVSSVGSRALRDATIEFTEGRQSRDFVFVGDVVEAALMAARAPANPGEIFNVCTGVETTARELVGRIVELAGAGSAVHFGARPHPPTELWFNSGDPTKSREQLGWSARTPLGEGLRTTLAWLRTGHLEEEVTA